MAVDAVTATVGPEVFPHAICLRKNENTNRQNREPHGTHLDQYNRSSDERSPKTPIEKTNMLRTSTPPRRQRNGTIRQYLRTTSRRLRIGIRNSLKIYTPTQKHRNPPGNCSSAVTTWKLDLEIHARHENVRILHERGITDGRPSIKRRGTEPQWNFRSDQRWR